MELVRIASLIWSAYGDVATRIAARAVLASLPLLGSCGGGGTGGDAADPGLVGVALQIASQAPAAVVMWADTAGKVQEQSTPASGAATASRAPEALPMQPPGDVSESEALRFLERGGDDQAEAPGSRPKCGRRRFLGSGHELSECIRNPATSAIARQPGG